MQEKPQSVVRESIRVGKEKKINTNIGRSLGDTFKAKNKEKIL